MTGKELKAKLIGCGVSQSEIARRLDISQQSFNQSMLVNDVKSGLLERIAKAIDVPMSFFYPNEGQKAVVNGDISKSIRLGLNTIAFAGTLALGVIFVSTITSVIVRTKHKKLRKRFWQN